MIKSVFLRDNQNRLRFFLYKSIPQGKDTRFAYFKQKVMEALDAAERRECGNKITKAVEDIIASYMLEKAGFPIGMTRKWNGIEYIKLASGKWRRKYDEYTRGAKQAINAIKRKADACTNSEDLLQLILDNRSRFEDKDGHPYPWVKDLHDYVSKRNDGLESMPDAIKRNVEAYKRIHSEKQKNKPQEEKKGYAARLRDKFKEKTNKYLGSAFKNKSTGNEAIFSNKSQRELCSRTQNTKDNGFTLAEHFELAGQIKELYEDATLEKTHDDTKHNRPDLKMERYLSKPVTLESGKRAQACITIKHSLLPDGRRIYSLEGMDIKNALEKTRAKGQRQEKPVGLSAQIEGYNKDSKKSSGFAGIKEKYQSSPSKDGDEDEYYLPNGESIQGHWKMVEADSVSASHDEMTFWKTEGFPTNKDGSTINDRDYEHDKNAQQMVRNVAADFDGRAIQSPVVVSKDGIVVSGNNRTMSSKLAARNGSDKKYLAALGKKAKQYGFSDEDVSSFKHPRLVFEADDVGEYTTEMFAKYNQRDTKTMSPVEFAVKVSKTIKPETVSSIAQTLGGYESISDFYSDSKATAGIFNQLVKGGVITKMDLGAYILEDGSITGTGEEFLETVLVGSIVNEGNIRQLSATGGRRVRQMIVKAITPLVENKGFKNGYSITDEFNDGVSMILEVSRQRKTFGNMENYAKQNDMFAEYKTEDDKTKHIIAVEIAKKLDDKLGATQKGFAQFVREMNMALKPASNGETDIFIGEVEKPLDILKRVLHINEIKNSIKKGFEYLLQIWK